MLSSLLALTQIFAVADPAQSLRDLQRVRERAFDLRTADVSLSFRPAVPEKYRFVSFRTRHLYDRISASYIQVYLDFPSFFSDATVANNGSGLTMFLEPDEPAPF
jgi:hypothetical protein